MNAETTAWEAALNSIASMIDRSENAQAKFAEGTSQHTLQKNRIRALRIASALIEREWTGRGGIAECTNEDLERARAPIASLISKSEKAQQKLTPGTWQHAMLEGNLRALHMAWSLLETALD